MSKAVSMPMPDATKELLFRAILVLTPVVVLSGLRAQEPQPADLVDVARLQGLSLEDLGWQEESRVETEGFVELRGSWLGPTYYGNDASGHEVHEVQLTEKARIWIPTSQGPGTTIHQVVVANHEVQFLNQTRTVYAELASQFPVASIRHAQRSEDWAALDFRNRDHWAFSSIDSVRMGNPCELGDPEHSNYPYALVRTQIMALTLLSRILEVSGYVPGPAAMLGISKEGFSAWAAAATDDRLVAIAPGGFPGDFRSWYQSVVDDYGCLAEMHWPTTLEWLKTTEAGQAFLKYGSVSEFAANLKAEFCLMWGDVGLDGLHDGDYFTAPAISRFQETFSAVPNRFDRLPDLDERETWDERRNRLVGLLAYYLVHRETTTYPEVLAEAVAVDDATEPTRFHVWAEVTPEPESVRLWWSHSTNRAFSDPGNAPWLPVEMVLDGDTWVSAWIDIPPGEMVGWFVEAERSLDWGGLQLLQRDASPQRFFNDPPPLTCPVPLPDCPPPAPTGLEATASPGRVDLDWSGVDAVDLAGYEVHRALAPDGAFERISGDNPLAETQFTDLEVENGRAYSYRVTAIDTWGLISAPSATVEAEIPAAFRRADSNADGQVDISDPVATLGYLFLGEKAPECEDAADANDDGEVDVSDAINTLGVLFLGQGSIPLPGMVDCGVDPTADEMGCGMSDQCT